ncbi:MAG: sulfite exporter TauE/SafE family protein [Rhodospirillaceae bacterium]|nr:sulfite exporter TauE/SafE family protein [Rhodospirillaceae bacterium]
MLTEALAVVSGSLVGLVLGLLGGGGSVLAVPLLLYVVGVRDPHMAIGTSAVAVAASSVINLALHARRGTVKWRCALTFAAAGSLGAIFGAGLGKAVDGQKLLLAFAVAMVGVGITMLLRKPDSGDPDVKISWRLAARLLPTGFAVGVASGFFGIGGGFLIVPGLIGAANMVMLNAVGSSLVAVTAFGGTTAASYAASGLVLWDVAGWFVVGGAIGGLLGVQAGARLTARKGMLTRIFAGFIFVTAAYIAAKSWGALF